MASPAEPSATSSRIVDEREPPWLEALRQRADTAPAQPRRPLWVGARQGSEGVGAVAIGSIEPALAARLVGDGLPLREVENGWRIDAPVDDSLAALARWLDEHRLGGRWRGELLSVTDEGGERRGAIERAAVRPLGITTHAVHLVGWTTEGALWIQQRAFDKANDPGMWDTLMGGLVAAGESITDTLMRETDEEAGLAVERLEGLVPSDRLTIRRPTSEGYMVEHIEVFEAVIPDSLVPANRDGEVERFELVTAEVVLERLAADAFTLEAALILAGALQRRGLLASTRGELA